MSGRIRKSVKHTFSAVAATTTWNLPPTFDPSGAWNLVVRQEFTLFTGGGPTMTTVLQVTRNGVTWDDRAAFTAQSAAISSGRTYQELTLTSGPPLSGTEEVIVPSGSTGGSALAAGTVRNGPFPERWPSNTISTWRIVATVANGSPVASGVWSVEYDSYP